MKFPSLILTVLLFGADSSNALKKIDPKNVKADHHVNGIGLPDEEPFMPPSSFENAVGITYTDGSDKVGLTVPKNVKKTANHVNGIGLPDEEPFRSSASFENAVGITYTDGSNKESGGTINKIHRELAASPSLIGKIWMDVIPDVNYYFESSAEPKGIALSEDGTTLAIGVYGIWAAHNFLNHNVSMTNQRVDVFKLNETTMRWELKGATIRITNANMLQFTNPIGSALPQMFGATVAISSDGNTVAIGAIEDSFGAGSVHVYRFINGVWTLLGNPIPGIRHQCRHMFGNHVSLSGDGNIVAAAGKGAVPKVFVYEYNSIANQWNPQAEINENYNYRGNPALILSGDGKTIAHHHTSFIIRVYRYYQDQWNRVDEIDFTGFVDTNGWGHMCSTSSIDLSFDGNTLAYGNCFGKVRVYRYNGNQRTAIGQDLSNSIRESLFGHSVKLSVDGNHIVVAAPRDRDYEFYTRPRAGSFRVYEYNGVSWIQVGLKVSANYFAFGNSEGQMFGRLVGISGDGARVVACGKTFAPYVRTSDLIDMPSSSPSISFMPSRSPSSAPSDQPSLSFLPSKNPSSQPSSQPSSSPSLSFEPSAPPSLSFVPSDYPSSNPTSIPTRLPSNSPSVLPSSIPSQSPSELPSLNPSVIPTNQPTKNNSSSEGLPSSVPTNPRTTIPSSSSVPTLTPTNANDKNESMMSAKPSVKTDSNLSTAPYSTPLVTQTTAMYIAFSAQLNDLENLTSAQVLQNIAVGLEKYLVRRMSLEKATVQLSIYDQANGNVSESNVETQANGRKLQTDEGAVKLVAIIQSTATSSNSGNMSERISDLIRNDTIDFPDVVKTSAGGFLDSLVGHIASLEDIYPSSSPSDKPSLEPTSEPSSLPSSNPSKFPSNLPSTLPSFVPSSVPSIAPSGAPTDSPSMKTYNDANGSSESPYVVKNVSFTPSVNPTNKINGIPSHGNSLNKTTRIPSASPSVHPSAQTFDPSAEPSMADSKILRKARVAAVAAGCGAAAASAAASASGGAAAAASSSASSSSSAASSSTGAATMSATTSAAAASSSGGVQTVNERPRMNLQEMQAMRSLDARNRNNADADADSDDDEEEHSTNNDIEMNLGQQDALQNEDDIDANVVIESDNSNPILRNTETNTQDTSIVDNSTNENESSIDVRERRSNDEHNTSLNNQLENETNLTVEKEGIDSFDLSNEKHSAGDTYARVEGGTSSLSNNSNQDCGKSKNDGIEKSDVAKSTGEEFSSTRSAANDAKSVDQSADDNRNKSPSLPHDQSNGGADQSYSVNDEVQQESHSIEQSTPNEHVGKSDITQAEASGIDNAYSKEVSDLPIDDNQQEPHSIEQSTPSEHVGKSDSTSKPSVVQAEERGMQSHANNDVEVSDSGNEPRVEDKYARVEGGTATLSNNHNKDSGSAVKGKEVEEILQVDNESAVESTFSEMKFADKLLLAEGALEDGLDTSLFEKYDDNKKSINKFMERVSTSSYKSGNNLDTIHDDDEDDVDKKGRFKFKRSSNDDDDILGVHFTVAIGITKLLLDTNHMEETLVVRRKDASPKMPSKLGRYFNFFGRKQHIRDEKSTIEVVKELADEENQLNFLNNDDGGGGGGVSASSSAFRSSAIQGLLDDVESSTMFNQRT